MYYSTLNLLSDNEAIESARVERQMMEQQRLGPNVNASLMLG